jgi:hypothetical protein
MNDAAGVLRVDLKWGTEYKCFLDQQRQFGAEVFNEARRIVDEQMRPCLEDGSAFSVRVSYPVDRFIGVSEPANARPFARCLAAKLVAFVAPDSRIYACVERAFQPEFCVGNLGEAQSLRDLYAMYRAPDSCHNCPPICILYETNLLWNELAQRVDISRREHDIEIARKYFLTHVAPAIGRTINFI